MPWPVTIGKMYPASTTASCTKFNLSMSTENSSQYWEHMSRLWLYSVKLTFWPECGVNRKLMKWREGFILCRESYAFVWKSVQEESSGIIKFLWFIMWAHKWFSISGSTTCWSFRTGKRTQWGLLMDGWNSMIRYYKNNFSDGFRQVGRNLHGYNCHSICVD